MVGSKNSSPIEHNNGQPGGGGHQMRRLSQNQNSINTYLEQDESKFDSTKDASDLGGAGGPGYTRDYTSSLPDSLKVMKGGVGYQHDQRSYDEAWQVDPQIEGGSQNSGCQPGGDIVGCDNRHQRLDSA